MPQVLYLHADGAFARCITQAVSAKAGGQSPRYSAVSSFSSSGEKKRSRDAEAENSRIA